MHPALAALVILAGATGPASNAEALLALRALDQRVAAVTWRLATANAELCPDKRPLTGLTLHEAGQYGGAARAEAVSLFGMSDAPAVQAVAPGSPAEAAGLRVDDTVTGADGADLRNLAPTAAPSHAHLAQVWSRIDTAGADGEVLLDVQRPDQRLQAVLRPVWGCAYLVQVRPSAEMNAWADGRAVTLTTALVRYARTDDELALIIGHELAHNLLRHPLKPSGAREREADRVGAYLAARAGYDITGAADFLRRVGPDGWAARLGFLTHPSASARSRAAAKTVAEIEARRAAGAPLIP